MGELSVNQIAHFISVHSSSINFYVYITLWETVYCIFYHMNVDQWKVCLDLPLG